MNDVTVGSVCAVMLVKDEADVIGYTIEHLLTQVDSIIVSDNGSTDGTRELLGEYAEAGQIGLEDDDDVAYWQSRKTTALAEKARELGFDWVIPCDADERWRSDDGTPIRTYLRGVTPDVRVIQACLFHYMPTLLDDRSESNPFARIGWRWYRSKSNIRDMPNGSCSASGVFCVSSCIPNLSS